MAPKNLKIGDTFIEGNGIYKITKLYPDGSYQEAERIGFAEDKTPLKELPFTTVEEAKEEEVTQLDSFNNYNKTEINRLNNAELTKVCEQLGLETGTGLAMKKAIIEKLGL